VVDRQEDAKRRKKFRFDDLKERMEKELLDQARASPALNGFMTLTFLGYYEKKRKISILFPMCFVLTHMLGI